MAVEEEAASRSLAQPAARRSGGGRPARMRGLATLAAVAAGGAVGGLARWGVDRALPAPAGGFPWATFAVNVAGACCLGLLLVLVLQVWPPRPYLRPFLAIGLLGSLTTFSTWMVELDRLLGAGRLSVAAAYLLASVAGGLAATSLGMVVGRGVGARRRAHPAPTLTEVRR